MPDLIPVPDRPAASRRGATAHDIARALRDGRRLILGCLAGSLLFALALNTWTTPVYRATTRLELHRATEAAVSGPLSFQSENLALYTSAMLITNRGLLEQVDGDFAQRDWLDPGVWSDQPRARARALARTAFAGFAGSARAPLPLRATGVTASADERVAWLASIVHVEPVQDTRLVDIRVDHPNPVAAVRIADRIAARFVAYAAARARVNGSAPAQAPAPGEPDSPGDVPGSLALAGVLGDTLADTLSVQAVIRQLNDRIARLTDELVRTDADEAVARAGVTRMVRWTRDSLLERRTLPVESAGLAELREQWVDAQVRLASARQVYGELHPRMRALRSELSVLQASGDRELERAVASARADRAALSTRAASLRADLGRTEWALGMAERRLPLAGGATSVSSASPPVEIVDRATLAPRAIRPRKLLNLAACLSAGGLAGCGLATLRSAGRRVIRSPEDVETELGVPLLGVLPRSA